MVPPDDLLRSIDCCVDLLEVRPTLASSYSSTGRPPVDPELMIRMLLVGCCYGIHSERRLCEEVGLNLLIVGSVALNDRSGSGSLDLLEDPSWSVPRLRFAPAGL
jgi:transposase